MPFYCYHCKSCDCFFEKFHSMKHCVTICEVCGIENNVDRVPQIPNVSQKNIEKKQKVGDATKQFIEEAKEDLKLQKKEMENEKEKII